MPPTQDIQREIDALFPDGSPPDYSVMDQFYADLISVNAVHNLTRIVDVDDFWIMHVLDSLLVTRVVGELLQETMTVADVGCGGGFPILPLAWANPKLTVMGIEARSKKAHFVAEEAARLGLSNASARAIQAREAARSDDYRQQYDAVVLRAVAETGRMVRDVRGLLKPGGAIINYKTPQAVIAERAITEREASKFGFTVTESEVFALPRDAGQRQFVVLRATSTSVSTSADA